MSDFLKELQVGGAPLSPDEAEKLESLGVQSPLELLSMIKADPAAFKRFYGAASTDALTSSLQAQVGTPGLALVHRRPQRFKTGAIVSSRLPRLKAPGYDLAERDRLFDELQELRAHPDPSDEVQARVHELESRLNLLLEGA